MLDRVIHYEQLLHDRESPASEHAYFFKLLVLTSIVTIGMVHLAGVPGFELKGDVEVPENLRWSKLWEGSGDGATAFITGLYSVIWWVDRITACASVTLRRKKLQVFCGLQPGELRSLRNQRPHTYDQTRQPDCHGLHHRHVPVDRRRLLWCSVEE